MANKMLLHICILILLAMVLPVLAQQQEIKQYKVQKGDTLWDISKKELNDPFLWPKVWKENPDISRPDKLIPGQTIKIPLYLIQKEIKTPEPVAAMPAYTAPEPTSIMPEKAAERAKPIVDSNIYISSGNVETSIHSLGYITGTPMGKTLIANLDMFYIKTRVPARLGDRFFVIKVSEELHHPITKVPIGRLVEVLGIAEVKKYENGDILAQLIKIFDEVRVGDLLYAYSDKQPPVISKPFRKPDLHGVIVATRQLRMNNGAHDIVYLDKGKRHGIEIGDLLQVIAVGEHKVPVGTVQIFKTDDSYSVAIVRESKDFITTGNYVSKASATE